MKYDRVSNVLRRMDCRSSRGSEKNVVGFLVRLRSALILVVICTSGLCTSGFLLFSFLRFWRIAASSPKKNKIDSAALRSV